MLLEFRFGNFLSYDEEQTFSMIGNDESDNSVNHNGIDIVRSAFIFGRNGSGKTNFINAVKYSRHKLINDKTEDLKFLNRKNNGLQFNARSKNNDAPSKFEYILETNGHIYACGLEYDTKLNIFNSQWLLDLNGDEPCPIFKFDTEMKNDDCTVSISTAHLPESDGMMIPTSIFREYIETKMKISFLSYMVENHKTVCSEIQEVFNWLSKELLTSDLDTLTDRFNKKTISLLKKTDLKSLICNLNDFDTAITGFEVEDCIINDGLCPSNGPDSETYNVSIKNGQIILTEDTGVHKILRFKHNEGNITDYNEESFGTRNIIMLLLLLNHTVSDIDGNSIKDKTLVIDEMGCGIHVNLLKKITKMISEKSKNDIQLIAVSHNVELLRSNNISRDGIWFVDCTDYHGSGSKMYRLSEFKNEGENVLKYYLDGRYGGIPLVPFNDGDE